MIKTPVYSNIDFCAKVQFSSSNNVNVSRYITNSGAFSTLRGYRRLREVHLKCCAFIQLLFCDVTILSRFISASILSFPALYMNER